MSTIYIISNSVNSKKYVGQTTTSLPIKRWNQHLAWAKRDPSKNDMLITRAIRKYGLDKFTIEYYTLHDGAPQNLLNQMECLAIVKYNSMSPNGYNIKEGGLGGKHSEETKLKMKGPRGPMSEEHKAKLRKPHVHHKQRYPRSAVHKLALSIALKGKSLTKSHIEALTGVPHSQSRKDAISASLKRFYAQREII